MDLNTIAAKHFEWVDKMGWHNKTVLEALALIASEIGEAADECITNIPTKAFGEELADIVLRTADLAHWQKIDLNLVVSKAELSWRSTYIIEDMSELLIEFAKWVNTARAAELGEDFSLATGRFVARVLAIAQAEDIDLALEVERKMAINERRGTRGRRV
jgi:NTP pyrophosphatase (non-canonical NTP hydrolase)